jgi:hypothetical protein
MNPTDPNSPRYTEATVELVMKTIYELDPYSGTHPLDSLDRNGEAYHFARRHATDVLDALADAGLLLKPGERAVHTATADEEAKDQW